jgi:flagellar L-ring protein precursor FlgH
MKRSSLVAIAATTAFLPTGPLLAADLYTPGAWPALASDRAPERVGDSLTVVIYENSTAINSSQNGSRRTNRITAQARAGSSDEGLTADLGGTFDAAAQTGRTGKLIAQISVTVQEVLPNGDLRVAGEQLLNINGEHTRIKLRGRVRRADVTGENTVLSTRLADAAIDYDGSGFVSRSSGPGVVKTIFNWLGLP